MTLKKLKVKTDDKNLKTNFVQRELRRFLEDDTDLNCDTKTILKR